MKNVLKARQKSIIPLVLYFVIFAGFIFSLVGISLRTYSYSIVDGKLNLTDKDIDNKVIELNGDWEIYQYNNDNEMLGYLRVPNTWSGKTINNTYIEKYNTLIYKLNINVDKPGEYCLKLSYISSAYELYVNDKLICSNGVIANNKNKEQSSWKPQFIYFTTEDTLITIKIKVSNYHCNNGGIVQPIYFGKQIPMYKYQSLSLVKHIIFLGMFLGLAFFLIAFNWCLNKKFQSLYLAVFCFAAFIAASIIDGESLLVVFPNLSIDAVMKIEYLAYLSQMTAIQYFLDCSYPTICKKHGIRIIMKFDLVYTIAIGLLPRISVLYSTHVLVLLVLINSVVYLSVIIAALFKKKTHSFVFLSGFIVYLVCSVLQLFYVQSYVRNSIINSFEVYYIGVFFFLLCQSYVLIFNVEDNYIKSKLAHEMEIASLQAQISPHFLFNVLNNINCLLESNIQMAKKLLLCLCEFLRAKYRFDYRFNVKATLREEIELIKAYIEIENVRLNNNITLQINIPDNLLETKILPMILQPIVENSIKHGYKSSPIRIIIEGKIVDNQIWVSVSDNGCGMSKEIQQNIFTNNKSKSVGLKNINYRTNKCYGTSVQVESKLDEGTKLTVIVPYE